MQMWLILIGVVASVSGQTLVFEDNFDSLDASVWQHEITMGGGGNWEFEYYTNNRSNAYVRDGNLYIKPTMTEDNFGEGFITSGTLDIWGNNPANLCTGPGWYGCSRGGSADNPINPIQSARLRSAHSFSFKYGRVEVSARMPKGDWIWPAIWMLPRWHSYGDWPSSGEIDIVESRGNLELTDEQGNEQGCNHAAQTMHWGPFFEANRYTLTGNGVEGDFGDSFHTYTLEWTPNNIVLSVDGTEMINTPPSGQSFWEFGNFDADLPGIDNPWAAGTSMAPFDQDFFLILNVAVGGTNGFFPDTWTNGNGAKPWTNDSPFAFRDFWNARNTWYPTWNPDSNDGEDAAMIIDYIRVYSDE